MKYEISYTNRFKQSLKKCVKRGLDIECLKNVINILQETGSLPSKYKPHKLKGNYSGCWECHIQPDWLLIYRVFEDTLILSLVRTGSHSDLDF